VRSGQLRTPFRSGTATAGRRMIGRSSRACSVMARAVRPRFCTSPVAGRVVGC